MSNKQALVHSPTLRTIRMVESALKNSDSVITIADLKRQLPKQVNHNVLIAILEYLEESNRIYVGIRGITWIHNTSPKWRKAVLEGTEH
jgi:hypothetical protein